MLFNKKKFLSETLFN